MRRSQKRGNARRRQQQSYGVARKTALPALRLYRPATPFLRKSRPRLSVPTMRLPTRLSRISRPLYSQTRLLPRKRYTQSNAKQTYVKAHTNISRRHRPSLTGRPVLGLHGACGRAKSKRRAVLFRIGIAGPGKKLSPGPYKKHMRCN